tara:strand:+ start:276 stop:635 length:360 start_codon:yes stop_codon:yes gene_type:complete
MKRKGATNLQLRNLVKELRDLSSKQNVKIWDRIANDLEKATRQRRIVNLSRINRFVKENESIIVPGKVLGSGVLDHKVTVAAFNFSKSAVEKISKVGACLTIKELIEKNPQGKGIRIIG